MGAKTRFLLKKISKVVSISFSVHQGDPLALVLYLLYVEPLLQMIKRNLTGIIIGDIPYVDNKNM